MCDELVEIAQSYVGKASHILVADRGIPLVVMASDTAVVKVAPPPHLAVDAAVGSYLHEAGYSRGLLYLNDGDYGALVMEREPGETLVEWLRTKPSLEAICWVYAQGVAELTYLASLGVAHNDVHGGNALVSSDGLICVTFIDWGQAVRSTPERIASLWLKAELRHWRQSIQYHIRGRLRAEGIAAR